MIVKKYVRGLNTAEAALDCDPDTFWSAPTGSHHAVLEADFAKPVTFDNILVMEWLNVAQREERFRIVVWTGKDWSTLVDGSAIGHKRIDHFPQVTTSRVRLHIPASSAQAHIREFQLFKAGSDVATHLRSRNLNKLSFAASGAYIRIKKTCW